MDHKAFLTGSIFVLGASALSVNAEEAPHHEAETLPVTHEAAAPAPASSEGALAKPLTIGDTGITLQFGGFVKADLLQDFDPIGNDSQFKVNSIPVSSDPESDQGGQTNIQAKQTRFSLDVRSDTSAGPIRAYVETDFFGSGNSLRLRHGYGEWRGFLAGQTWTTFQDITARPMTIDYEGPDGEFFVRQAMFRYTGKISDTMEWSVAAEDPDSQISINGAPAGTGRSNIPDFPARLRFTPDWGHIQVAALLRQIRYVSNDGDDKDDEMGFGLNLSGKVNLSSNDSLMGHVGFGSGISRYIESFGGTGSDAVVTADGLETIDSSTFVVGYTHKWNDTYASTISGSYAELDDEPGVAGDAIKSASSMHVNLIYTPNPLILLGAELMWGERENFNGDDGDAVRLQISAQYNFR